MDEPDPHRSTTDPEPEGSGKEFASDVGDPPDDAVPGEAPGSGKQFAEPEQSIPRDDDEPEPEDRPRS